MLPIISSPKDRGERKMDIARKVAAELFGQKYQASTNSNNGPTSEQLQKQARLLKKREKGLKRTLLLISDPLCNAIYSMKTELRLITERNIEILNLELNKLAKRENLKFSTLVSLIDQHMHLALFGCSVDIGICTDSSAKVIEFFGDPNYRRKVRRGDSNCFTAIDRKDVVVEAISKTKKNPLVHFAEGDHVVYIPMFGTSSAQGVIEIYGLQTIATAGPSHREVYQRSPTVLKAMINAKDFKFVNTVRLWKKPPTTPKINEDGEVGKFYGVDAFIVAGYVTAVAHGRRGVPYYGGPRYTITWENGEVDEEITATDLLAHYKETPQSLGCSNTLDAWLSDNLFDIATAAGHILEAQRVKTFLVELRQRVQRNNMKANIISEIGIESVASMINGTREISMVGYNTKKAELNTLVDFFPVRNALKSVGKQQEAPPMQHTVFTIGMMMVERTLQSDPLVVPDDQSTDWVAVEMVVPKKFVWSVKANYDRYFIVMNRSKFLNSNTSELDLLVIVSVVDEISQALKSLWEKELRKRARRDILKDLEQKMFEWKTSTVQELCYNVIQHIAPHLSGADVYIGLVEPGGDKLTYISSSNKSKMEGKVLKRSEGVSFDVVETLGTIVLRPEDLDKGKLLLEGSIVDVFYGRKLHRCKIEKIRGHEKFDVRYDCDHKVEAGVDVSRIVPHSFAFRMKKFGKAVYPFMCVALKNRTKAVGVIGMDSFTQIPKADHETHPDPDLVAFMEKVGSILGANIDIQRKKLSMQVLYTIAKNQFTEVPDVIAATFQVLFSNMTNVVGMLATRFIYEDSEPKRQHGLHVLEKKGNIPQDMLNRMEAFNPAKSSLKSVQKYGERIMWMLCRLRPAVRTEQGKIFIFGIITASPISEPDQEYVSAVQKLVAGTLQNIVSFKAVTEMRYEALKDIRALCETASEYPRQKFFNRLVDCVQTCFYSANMYVGVLSPYNKSLEYILASFQSDMAGKSLVRADMTGVSFRVVDELMPIGVAASSPLAFNLHHFGPRQQFEFPYIGIPLIVHMDAMIGVLGVDHCEDPSAVSDVLTDTTSFFSSIGNSLGQVIRTYREEDARTRLLQIARDAKTFNEGIRQIKKVILEILPFAKRILEIAYEPIPAETTYVITSQESAATVKEAVTETTENYRVLLQVPAAFCTSTVAKNVELKCIWQGNIIFSCKISPDGETQLAPATISIPKNVSVDIIKVQFILFGTVASSEREIAHKEIDWVYLVNSPLYIMEHFLESVTQPNSTARVGKFQLLSKVFEEMQVVGFAVTEIQVKGMSHLHETYHSHKSSHRQTTKEMRANLRHQSSSTSTNSQSSIAPPKMGNVFALLRWNDEVLLKTQSQNPLTDLAWSNLNIYMKMDSILLPNNLMQVEVWDERKNGEPDTAYGRLDLDGNSLQAYFEGNTAFLELGAIFPEGVDHSAASSAVLRTNAVIRIKGRVITAAGMSAEHMKEEFSTSLRIKSAQAEASTEKDRPYHLCEVCVICARELGRSSSWPAGVEADSFAIVYFNGEEIGRSAVVKSSSSPAWSEEAFRVRVPGDDDVDQCIMVVEIHHLDPQTSLEVPMGRVELQGKSLANFLTSNKMKVQWFDIESKDSVTPQDNTSAGGVAKSILPIEAQGELKLSGRPVAVDVTGQEEAKELGHMELTLLGFANVNPPDLSKSSAIVYKTFSVVYFNDKKVHRSKLADNFPDGSWEKEKVTFRYPNSRPLFQCKLKVELWLLKSTGLNKTEEILLGNVELTGSNLGKLMGQKGLITKWLPISSISSSSLHEKHSVARAGFSPEVQVKGGPLGGKDIYEDCEENLLLDILAATRLPFRPDSATDFDRRPSSYAEIIWNQKKIGRTAIVSSSSNPIWNRQRFMLRIPLLTTSPDVNVLSMCKLRIELYDSLPEGADILVGCLKLEGEEIESLFGQEAPTSKWYPINTRKDLLGNLDEEYLVSPDNSETFGAELRLRGMTSAAVLEEPKPESTEHLLQIVSAQDLSNTDIFGGADAFVSVDWMGDKIGKTQIIPKSVNPTFENETFILKQRTDSFAGSPVAPTLLLSVFSKIAVSSVPAFLGQVHLDRSELKPLLSADVTSLRNYTLTTSPELTDEENHLVKGALSIRFSKIKPFPQNVTTKRDSMLWVVSSANLPQTSAFGISSEVFCRVFRRSEREGGDDFEVAQTNVVKSLCPVFQESYIPLEIPAYEDWSGFQLRVEVWDSSNEPIGVLVLLENDAKELLGRDGEEVVVPVTYELMDGAVASSFSPPPSAVPGSRVHKTPVMRRLGVNESTALPTITLAGGMKEDFELSTLRRERTVSNASASGLERSASVSRVRSVSESSVEGDITVPGTPKSRNSKRLKDRSSSQLGIVEKGDEAFVSIVALDTTLEAKKMFCTFKWKTVEVGRTTNANPEADELPWKDEKVTFSLERDNNLAGCVLEVEIFSTQKRDLPLGVAILNAADLSKLFDPALEQIEFPVIEFKGSRSLLGRKKNVGTITLLGRIPRVKEEYDELHRDVAVTAVEQEDPELLPMRFEIELIRATRLPQSSKQVFATLHWRNASDPAGKSDIVSGTGHVEFDCEFVTIEKPQGVRLTDCSLRACLYIRSVITSHTLLGEITISGEQLKTWLTSESSQEFILSEKINEKMISKDSPAIIHVASKKLIDLSTSHMFNNTLPLPSHLIEIEVCVIAAHGLAKVNTIGLSNPYCKLQWGRAALGQTTVLNDTVAPIWEENETFTVRAPNTWDYKKKRRQTTVTPSLALGPSSSDMTLTLSMYSSNRIGDDVFMGSAEITGEELAKFVGTSQFNRKWFNLRTNKRLKQKEQKFVGGRVQILLSHKPKAGEGDFAGKDIEVVICAGRDLPKRKDNAAVDVYIRPRWNGKILGKTFHSLDSITPQWEDERFHSRLPGSVMLEDCILELEVWQYQKANTKSILAGVVILRDNELREFIENSNFSPTWFTITASPFTPATLLTPSRNSRDMSSRGSQGDLSAMRSLQNMNNGVSKISASFESDFEAKDDPGLGQLQIRCGFSGRFAASSDSMVPYELTVFSAKDLGKADMLSGLSDPYVICKWNGREIGRTPHAPRTINPTWTDQKFLLMLDPNENIGQNLLQIQVWNYRVITKGEFLGSVYLTGPALEEWFAEINKLGRSWSNLGKSPTIEDSRQSLVKGKVELGFQVKLKDSSSGSVRDALSMQWSEICANEAGQPMVMFSVSSVQQLPVVDPLASQSKGLLGMKTGASPPTLICAISWMGQELARTAPVTLDGDDKTRVLWPDAEEFHFRLPADTDDSSDRQFLLLQLLDISSPNKPLRIGKLEFTFSMLWTLYTGVFTFPLLDTSDDMIVTQKPESTTTTITTTWGVSNAVSETKLSGTRGTVTFRLHIVFPFWDSIRSIVPRTYLRKLSICGASNLPLINEQAPNPKCVVMFDGAIKAKTIALMGIVAPNWPRVDIDIMVDMAWPIEVSVLIYHVSQGDKREILIGQETIPFDYFLRPPAGQFDLFLGPSNKRIPEYKFTTSGSVRLLLTGSNQLSEASKPYSARLEKPTAALVAKDMRSYGRDKLTSADHELNGSILSPEERHWLGTACDFVLPQQLACKPEWVVLPIHDMGMRIGPRRADLIGTTPGFKFSLCIEREAAKANVSDPMLLQSLSGVISECITKLRKKDIYRRIRDKALTSLRIQVQQLSSRPDFSKEMVMKHIQDIVRVCLPGVQGRTGMASLDSKMIEYHHFNDEDSGGTLTAKEKPHSFLFENQGADWDILGRTQNRSLVVGKYADFSGSPIAIFGPFPMCRYPRFSVPLRSGDAALGLFQLENFDTVAGGMNNGGLTDESELRAWLEEIGDACGAAMYFGNEARVLGNIDAFCACWNSSIDGLIADLVKDCLTVVQGCRLMEILTIDPEYNVKSLLQSKPESSKTHGTMVVFQRITIREHIPDAPTNVLNPRRFGLSGATMFGRKSVVDPTATTTAEGNPAPRRMSMFRRKSVVSPPASVENATADPSDTASLASSTQPEQTTSEEAAAAMLMEQSSSIALVQTKQYLVGIRYEGVEQVHTAEYDSVTKTYLLPDIHVNLKSDRLVFVALYEVDDHLNILSEHVGKFNFQTFQETDLKTTLSAPVPITSTATNPPKFDALVSVHWPTKFEFVKESGDHSNIKGFKVHITSAKGLQAVDKKGFATPFCEVSYGRKMIKQTEPKKKTLSPVWNEEISVPFTGHRESVFVDVYDMNFLRKGEFLGRVEIPHDHLVNTNGQEIDFTLKAKPDMNIKKQTKVGGVLTLSCSVVETTAAIREREAEQSRKDRANAEIPAEVWDMLCPTLELTVKSATDLARANRFGGSSDPFVLVYIGNDTDATEKTHYISNTLNPKWNAVLNLILGVAMEKGVTGVNSFPTIRLEVYDYNKVKTMDFLGSCEIPPAVYFSRKEGDFTLKPIARKKNDLVKGKIQVSFRIVEKETKKKELVYSYSSMRTLQSIVAVEVHIMKAKGLMQANQVGNSDPYVVLKWNNEVYGQTSVKINTLNPIWNGEKFIVNILTHGGFNIGEMTFEVWDKDFFKDGDFMGEAKVTSDVFMHPAAAPVELLLKPRPGADPTVVNKVQGTLTVKFNVRIQQQRPPCEQQPPREYIMPAPSLDPITLLMAYDPEQEYKRQKRENMEFATIMDKTTTQMDKYTNSPFERTGLISELHYGQLTAASRRAEQTILKTSAVDMVCVPTYKRGARPDQCFYLMARYETGKIPRRDMQFLGKIQGTLYRGICHINDREQRLRNLSDLQKGLEVMSTATDNPSGIIVQAMLDMEVTMNCAATLYLLGVDGCTLTKCSTDIGEVDPETPPADEYVFRAAQICRYGFIIQKYRGEYSIISTQWDGFTQLTVTPLSSMAAAFDELEHLQIIKNFITACNMRVPDGAIFAPLLSKNEVLMGLVVLTKVDAVPVANYRQIPTEGVSSIEDQKPYTVVQKMEHGFTNCVKSCTSLFADGLLSSRMGTVFRKIKSFPIKPDTDPVFVIRYAIRLLVTAIPAIRYVSVWAVNLHKAPVLLLTKEEVPAAPTGVLSRMMSMSARVSKRLSGLSSKKASIKSEATAEQTAPVKKIIPTIVAGMFGTESPQQLLAATVERNAHNIADRGTVRQSAVRGHHGLISDLQHRTTEHHAKWRVDVPAVIKKSSNKGSRKVETIAEEQEEEEEDEDDKSSLSEEGSAKESASASKEFSDPDETAMNLIHAEISRCVKVLQVRTFRVVTGHILSALGTASQSRDLLSTLFPRIADLEEEDVTALTPAPPSSGTPRSVRPERAPLPPNPRGDSSNNNSNNNNNNNNSNNSNKIINKSNNNKQETFTERLPPGTGKDKPSARIIPPNKATTPAGSAPPSALLTTGRRGLPLVPPAVAVKDAKGTESTSVSIPERLSTINAAGKMPLLETRARAPPAGAAHRRNSVKPSSFFISVNSDGIGGNSGWGIMGESMEKILSTITELMETNLMKLAEHKAKAVSEAAKAASGQESPPKSSSGAFGDRPVDAALRPSMMIQREDEDEGEYSADRDDASDSMEEIE